MNICAKCSATLSEALVHLSGLYHGDGRYLVWVQGDVKRLKVKKSREKYFVAGGEEVLPHYLKP